VVGKPEVGLSKPEPARLAIMVALPEFARVQFGVPLVVLLTT
jgi:hypothetical protein